jgi:hypothetical protein
VINNQELLAAWASFKLGVVGARGGRDCGRRAKRSGSRTLRTLLLESGSESIVGGSEMVYSLRRRQRRAKKDALRASTIPLLASIRHSRLPSSGPPSVTVPTADA